MAVVKYRALSCAQMYQLTYRGTHENNPQHELMKNKWAESSVARGLRVMVVVVNKDIQKIIRHEIGHFPPAADSS